MITSSNSKQKVSKTSPEKYLVVVVHVTDGDDEQAEGGHRDDESPFTANERFYQIVPYWSTCSPSSLTICVRIPPKSTLFIV